MERQGLLGLLDHQASVGCLACQESLGQKAIVDSQDWMALRERWVAQV